MPSRWSITSPKVVALVPPELRGVREHRHQPESLASMLERERRQVPEVLLLICQGEREVEGQLQVQGERGDGSGHQQVHESGLLGSGWENPGRYHLHMSHVGWDWHQRPTGEWPS